MMTNEKVNKHFTVEASCGDCAGATAICSDSKHRPTIEVDNRRLQAESQAPQQSELPNNTWKVDGNDRRIRSNDVLPHRFSFLHRPVPSIAKLCGLQIIRSGTIPAEGFVAMSCGMVCLREQHCPHLQHVLQGKFHQPVFLS